MKIKLSKSQWEGLNKKASETRTLKYYTNDKLVYKVVSSDKGTDTYFFANTWVRSGDITGKPNMREITQEEAKTLILKRQLGGIQGLMDQKYGPKTGKRSIPEVLRIRNE